MAATRESDHRVSQNTGTSGESTWERRLRRIVGAAIVGVGYWTLVRPRMLNWGATTSEEQATLPGDDVLSDPDAESTMAITIDAPPDAIWPWLLQLGQDRGGFYSHEWAENLVGLDIHNADQIYEEWQDLDVGDLVRLGDIDRFPDATLEVVEVEQDGSLVLRTPDEPTWWVWSFVLDPVDETKTRLLVRSRIRLPENAILRFAVLGLLDPVSFVMTHGMLHGIKSRAERLSGRYTQ